jgi:hypothetical protein
MPKREKGRHWLDAEVESIEFKDGDGNIISTAQAMPWTVDSASVQGRKAEKIVAKKWGARTHSNSGAGVEKEDFSTDEVVYEYKNVAKSHTLSGEKLRAQLQRALQQGKDSRYVVYFEDFDVTIEGELRRGR